MKLKKLLQRGTILLVVSVLLNFFLLHRLGQMEQRLAHSINYATAGARRASNDVGNLYHQLRQLKEEQEWLAQADFSLEDVSSEGALLTGTFDFRSVTPGAQVLLQVRPAPGDDWYADNNASPGLAGEAKFTEKKAGQGINSSSSPWTGTGTAKPTEENDWQDFPAASETELTYKAKFQIFPDKNYEYRLVCRSQNAISASPITQLPPEVYRRPSLMPQLSWGRDRSGKLTSATIELAHLYEPPKFPAFKAVSAILEIQQENNAVVKHAFAAGPYHQKVPFVLENLTDLPPNALLFATVQYADGYTMNVHIGGTDSKGVPDRHP